MEFNSILNDIIKEAKKNKKRIILPEGSDERVLEAAYVCAMQDIAKIIIIGDIKKINDFYLKKGASTTSLGIKVLDPNTDEKIEHYAYLLFELRKEKGMTLEIAKATILNEVYYATLLLKLNEADGIVCGAVHSSSDTLRPALQIIKQKHGLTTASSFFLMINEENREGLASEYIFSDCGLVEFPTQEQLVDITICSANTYKMLTKKEPKVALLSYSTKGSAKSNQIDITKAALASIRNAGIDFKIDGELQLDAAVVPSVAKSKDPEGIIKGEANVLIFPDLQAGNISYKMAQRFGGFMAIGPITQGLNKPVNDLSRGCNVKDIVGAIAITCVQANNI